MSSTDVTSESEIHDRQGEQEGAGLATGGPAVIRAIAIDVGADP